MRHSPLYTDLFTSNQSVISLANNHSLTCLHEMKRKTKTSRFCTGSGHTCHQNNFCDLSVQSTVVHNSLTGSVRCLWSSPHLASKGKVLGEIRGLLHFAIGIRYCLFILWFLTLLCIKACISCRWWVLHYTSTCRCPWQDWSRAELSRWSPRHNDPALPCVGQTCNPSLAKSLTACIGRRPLYLLRQASTPGELCRLGAKSGVQGWVGCVCGGLG